MKTFWLLPILLFGIKSYAVSSERYLLLPDFIGPITRNLRSHQLEYTDSGVSLVRVPDTSIDNFSRAVHKEMGGCGGFIDITEEVRAGKSPYQIVWEEIQRRETVQKELSFEVRGDALVESLVFQISNENLWSFLTELSAMADRSATTDFGTQAADLLFSRADALGKSLPGFSVTKIKTGSYPKQPSVIATLIGTNPSLEHVVIGAHMDTLSSSKPGADDDGSGSALVMESLRVISGAKAKFEHTIDFIWYSAEEQGLVGSSSVVQEFKKNKTPVKAAIQFDMVGYKRPEDTEDIYLVTDYTNASLNDALKNIIKLYTKAKVGETKCGYACSDHANWTRGGIPSAFPFEATFGKDNPKIHTGNDKIQYLDKNHTLYFAQTAVAFLGEIAKLKSLGRE